MRRDRGKVTAPQGCGVIGLPARGTC